MVRRPKICINCLIVNEQIASKEEFENRKEAAKMICRKWLSRAPIEREYQWADQDSAKSAMMRPWVENVESFAEECAKILRIGGGFPPGGRFSFHNSIKDEMLKLTECPACGFPGC